MNKEVTTRLESKAHKRLSEYCKKNGLKKTWVNSRAVEEYLENKTGGKA